ncbi:MAG: hypothetical protein Tsb0016_15710 [Sphingomonadales bacterium]
MVRVDLPDRFDFATYVAPIAADTQCGAVYDRFMLDPDLLALAVVEDGIPVGLVNRHDLIQKLAQRYGRPLYEAKPITQLMDAQPLIVDQGIGIAMLNRLIVNERPSALMQGFIVTENGRYAGIGTALSVLTAAVDQSAKQAQAMAGLADQLRLARDAAEAASATKSQFLATMSHEIRTPMNAILGMAHMLGRGRLSGVQRQQLAVMTDASEALLALLNDILDLSKIESGCMEFERTDVALAALVESLQALWRPEADKKSLALDFTIAPGVPAVILADPTRLRQILSNLISNAIKFTKQGAVTVTIAPDSTAPRTLLFCVRDTGIGIAPDVLPRLFDKFSQADSSTTRHYGGTGLGLAICKQLVDQLGGAIGCESAAGAGTHFWFSLPFEEQASAAVPAATTTPADAACVPAPLHILVVEDNPLNQAVIEAMLREQGHRLTMANNGHEGVAAVGLERFDLVLMDVRMPEMDGVEATRRIRAMGGDYAALPIIALTADSMAGDRERYLAAGMSEYLAKPIRPAALHAMLSHFAPAQTAALARSA